MLNTWGGNGMDSVSDEEYQKVGFDKCTRYCSEYCWHHGMGFCDDCAYDKELRKRRKMESEVQCGQNNT